MDFALFLVLATFATGLIWLLDALLLKRLRRANAPPDTEPREPLVVEYAKSFFPVLLIVLLLRSFLFEPFRIPSGSMMPTLLTGDFIFVNKFAYGLRLPVVNTKIADIGEPKRGDVVVFRLPSDPSINYIKRVVGLPGDTVYYDQDKKRLTIDGKPIPLHVVGPYPDQPETVLGEEQLGHHDHNVLLMTQVLSRGGTYQVPKGHYFCMGDNRDNSEDSRYPQVSFVPEGNLVGRAERIWMSWRPPSEGGPRWSRIGMHIE
ncbi:MAG TPA: signal peptidase I [Gammaproteobacteria bacterium]|nr:signal peptidase I [Gammaproteobacteria bacterium]